MADPGIRLVLQHLCRVAARQATEGVSDQQLVERFVAGRDEDAFAALVQRHGPMVTGVCHRLLRKTHDAEDAFQATFLVLACKAASIRKVESVGSWLHGVALRVARKARVEAARRTRRERQRPAPAVSDAGDALCWGELRSVLDEELGRLPASWSAPLILCYLEGQTQDEGARRLGWSKSTFRRRLERGRRLLQSRLARRGVTLSAGLLAPLLSEPATAAALSTTLIATTVKMALLFGGGKRIGTEILAKPVTLAESVLKSMVLAQCKLTAVVVLTVGLLAASGLGAYQVVAEKFAQVPGAATPPSAVDRSEAQPAPSPRAPVDQLGDPLPPDVVTRMGTSRFWCGANGRTQVAFTPDGGTILAAHWVGVFVLDATTGKQFRHISTFAAKRIVDSMSVSPDGKYLALATNGWEDNAARGIQIWELATGQLVSECHAAGDQQYAGVRFSPDGKMLASYSCQSKTIYLWDPATRREIHRWPLALGFSGCFTFSPDSKTLIVGDLRTIHFWDTATGKEVRRVEDHPGGCIYRLFLTHDGTVLATQALTEEPKVGEGHHQDNKVHLWDAATGNKLRHIEIVPDASTKRLSPAVDPSQVSYFQFSPDAKTLVTASGDGMLRAWDVAMGKERCRWDTSGWISSFAFSPDGKKLASLGGDHTVNLWDAVTGKELREHPSHRRGIDVLALSPDGRTLASAGWDRDVRLWDAPTGRAQHQLAAADRAVHALHFSADGSALTTLGNDGKARIWETATGKELRQFLAPVEARARPHVISPDGKTWASGSGSDLVIWDAATGKKRQVCVGHQGVVIGALGFSPDSGTLYSWSLLGRDRKVRLWDVVTGKMLREFAAGDEAGVYTGSFSANGKWFACGGMPQLLLLYDVATGTAVHRLEIPALRYGNARGFAISPDSRTLAVGDEQGTIHLVELASGKFRQRLVGGHQGNINALLFAADGKRLVSGSTDTTALVWDLTGQLNASAKPISAADLNVCWTDLAGEDAERAYQSIRRLAASPTTMIPYVSKQLQPAASVDARHVDGLIIDLASDQFTVRDQAFKELESLGELAIAACRKALAGEPALEQRRRLEMLLEQQEQERRSPSLPRLRILRALEALEFAGTPQSRQLLQKLAGGAPEACVTREAKAALERLAWRPRTLLDKRTKE